MFDMILGLLAIAACGMAPLAIEAVWGLYQRWVIYRVTRAVLVSWYRAMKEPA